MCAGFAELTPAEKEAAADLLVRIAPSLAAQEGRAAALPMGKIWEIVWGAIKEAWIGIARPKVLAADLGAFLQSAPEAAELRAFCQVTAARIDAAAALDEGKDGQSAV